MLCRSNKLKSFDYKEYGCTFNQYYFQRLFENTVGTYLIRKQNFTKSLNPSFSKWINVYEIFFSQNVDTILSISKDFKFNNSRYDNLMSSKEFFEFSQDKKDKIFKNFQDLQTKENKFKQHLKRFNLNINQLPSYQNLLKHYNEKSWEIASIFSNVNIFCFSTLIISFSMLNQPAISLGCTMGILLNTVNYICFKHFENESFQDKIKDVLKLEYICDKVLKASNNNSDINNQHFYVASL